MSREHTPSTPLFTQVDISAGSDASPASTSENLGQVLRQMLAAQDRQNELLEELITQVGSSQRQRANELNQWKQANPDLARACRHAAEVLSRVQGEFLTNLTDEIQYHEEALADGDFGQLLL